MIRGVLCVDLAEHLEDDGSAGVKAENAAWATLAAAPADWAVNVNLGSALWVTDRLLMILHEQLQDAPAVQVTGHRTSAVQAVLQRLQEGSW